MSRRSAPLAVGLALGLQASVSPASSASLTYSDGVCAHRIPFDAAQFDRLRLQATFDHLADPGPPRELAEPLATQEQISAAEVGAYRARCAAHHDRLAALRLLDLPRLEALRTAELAELDTTCKLTEASLAAAKGDLGLARALAPACSRYTDLLALPPERLKAQWNDQVLDLCASSTERNVCAGHLQRSGEGPGSPARRRIAVIDRWVECASRPLPELDAEREKLRAGLAKRFKAKTVSCAQ